MSTLIKKNLKIRKLLFKRFNEQNMLYGDIITDAKKHGKIIDKPSLSRYFSRNEQHLFIGDIRGSLSEGTILWLCTRWAIHVSMDVTYQRYDKKECLRNIKRLANGEARILD